MSRKPTPSEAPVPLDGTGRADDEVELGYVSGFFGVRGEVRLHLHNRESRFFAKTRSVVLVAKDGRRRSARLSARAGAGRRVIGRISGVNFRDQSVEYKDWRIVVQREQLPELEDDEFYLADVEGLAVLVDGQRVGRVKAIHATGSIEVLELDLGDKDPEFVPCRAELVTIDIDGGMVHIVSEALADR